jgi:hypothetical protein
LVQPADRVPFHPAQFPELVAHGTTGAGAHRFRTILRGSRRDEQRGRRGGRIRAGGRGSAGGGSLRDSPMTATRPTPPLPLTATMALPPSSRAGSEAAGSGGEAAEAVWGRLRHEGGGSDAAGVPPVSLLRGAEHVIGRSKVCKLVLQSSRISGQHAAFFIGLQLELANRIAAPRLPCGVPSVQYQTLAT